MGWGLGVELFDGALDVFLKYVPEDERHEAVKGWYDKFKWTDWDTQDESDYSNILSPVRVELEEIEPACPVCGYYTVYGGECEGECYEL